MAENPSVEKQTGTFFCSGCGRQFRHTHDGRTICVTSGCKFKDKGNYKDDYGG